MSNLKLSVIVPTRDRPEKLNSTLAALARQQDIDPRDYELIVVDDGSDPPVAIERGARARVAHLIRLDGDGRSVARNKGAEAAGGELLVFVDDDVLVSPGFLSAHWGARLDWPGALQVGATPLPETALAAPFGRFRQRLEDALVPDSAGPLQARRFTAQNMAVERSVFRRLGGFDPELSVGEDQDLALRHTADGGPIVFVPQARGVHDDHDALDLESYCARGERYMAELVRLGARHPDWPGTVERALVNGPVRLGGEPASLTAKKLLKGVLMWAPMHAIGLGLVSLIEKLAPDSGLLDRLYRVHLGAHLQRGYRRGLRDA
jgi:glycosyltransferase involved in cell wall biosynthesis